MVKKDKTIFVEYFGDSPTTRVLEFFIENDLYDYSKSDIFRETGVARTTLQEVMQDFLARGIVIRTRSVGRANMYKLNRGNSIVEEILKFALSVVAIAAKSETATAKLRN